MEEKQRTLGKYTLIKRLAMGGMAEIFLAEQEGPGGFRKKLVIKQILQSFAEDENFKTMFQDEARLVAQLTHPKIAQIYELGEVDSALFIAMEFVEGVDLDQIIQWSASTGQPVPIEIVVKLMVDLLEALDYAHDFSYAGVPYNLVHRDVTPHNVMVSNDGIVKLLDFGVAKAMANQSKTQAGAVKGKFAYMAPEQVESKDLDRRADIFAVGIVMYEILCGQKPFGDDLGAIVNVVSKPTPDIREIRADVPADLVNVIFKATAKRPDERYEDAHEMLSDLQNYLRSSGAFVGDREVANFVRQMQGIPTTRASAAASGPRRTMAESPPPAVQSASGSGPMMTIATPPPVSVPVFQTPDGVVNVSGGPSTAELPGLESYEGRTDTQAITLEDSGTRKMFGIFLVLFVALISVVGVIVFLLISDGPEAVDEPISDPVVKKVQTPDKVKVEETPFNHPNGVLVSISSRPSADVFFEGKKVGSTPMQTSLRAGTYSVTLKQGSKSKSHSFTVDSSKFVNRVSVDL